MDEAYRELVRHEGGPVDGEEVPVEYMNGRLPSERLELDPHVPGKLHRYHLVEGINRVVYVHEESG